jgi:flagellin-like hook-associated protein FlgL
MCVLLILESIEAISNLQTSHLGSRIQNADFAAKTSNITRATILQKAGMAMLAQAPPIW